ncbi:MAG: ABC-F family ATP-binding cassette domain-containing protein, partial [Bacteroidetes bacterium]|nr:ABC-F family ATP-binding cassette domain-containing protein [Bacteroidota bacterium]
DEPTNHLDIDVIEWLEQYLYSYSKSLLLVTHDRYFLNEVCNKIIEIDNHQIYEYKGNFEYYIEKKAERMMMEASELEKAKNLYRRELEWVRKMPKARTTKSKSRVDAFEEIAEKAKQKRQDKKIELNVKVERLGSKIIELIKISKSYGDKKILDGFTYTFKKGEKIGIVGKNGVGKSTFLNIIQGHEGYDGGKIQVGETVIFGYYSQKGIQVSDDKRIIEVVTDIAEFIPLANGTMLKASQLLQRFNFPPEMQYSYVRKLSGGEKRRLYLLTVLMKNPNFLILDEPTNDLDIVTLQTLEDFLMEFQGCVLLVSHDRYFLDKLVDHVFAFEGNGIIKDYPGNYTEYRNWKDEQGDEPAANETPEKLQEPAPLMPEPAVVTNEGKPAGKKLSFKEQRELELLEKDLGQMELRKKEIEELLNGGEADVQKIHLLSEEYTKLLAAIDSSTMRWLELQD